VCGGGVAFGDLQLLVHVVLPHYYTMTFGSMQSTGEKMKRHTITADTPVMGKRRGWRVLNFVAFDCKLVVLSYISTFDNRSSSNTQYSNLTQSQFIVQTATSLTKCVCGYGREEMPGKGKPSPNVNVN